MINTDYNGLIIYPWECKKKTFYRDLVAALIVNIIPFTSASSTEQVLNLSNHERFDYPAYLCNQGRKNYYGVGSLLPNILFRHPVSLTIERVNRPIAESTAQNVKGSPGCMLSKLLPIGGDETLPI